MTQSLTKKYNIKKETTLKGRKCGFELTLPEYKSLMQKSTTCDYTGVRFESGKYARSIERINDGLPYRKDNCCVVTIEANTLKERMRRGYEIHPCDVDMANRIKNTLETKTPEELVAKYQLLPTQPTGEVKVMSNNTVNTQELFDITVAKAYIKFNESNKDSIVSFSTFKKVYSRKTCALSGSTFVPESNHLHMVFAKKDVDKPYTDDNIQPVCKILALMKSQELFTKKELTKFIGVL